MAGRYALSHLIASGGMAEVWQATDTVLERQVAVKLLHRHLSADDSFVGRFRTEAVAAARLHHPAIVSIYDTCSDGNVEAIVMELVRGQTLRQYLDDAAPLPPEEVIDIGAEVADALEAAHRSGLVHRDIKPANILLCEDHRVMVTDFGIAKLRDDTGERTTTGTMLGTVKYLAPEQVEGAPVDGRTDIYALGVVMYEAICGRPPFTADSQAATALARLHSTPPRPRQIRPSVSRGLDEVIMRAISRDPDDRYPSAAELRAALLAVRGSETMPANPQGYPRDLTAVSASELTSTTSRALHYERPRSAGSPRRHHRWALPVLMVIIVMLVLAIVGVLAYRTRTGENPLDALKESTGVQLPGATPSVPLRVLEISAFDPPPGDGKEDSANARNVADGNPSTAWRTEQYDTRKLGGIKPGVGVLFKLDKPSTIEKVAISSPTNDWAVTLYVADKPGGSLADWGRPVAVKSNINGNIDVALQGVKGQYVLLWVTDLGNSPPRVAAQIDEVELIGHQ